MDGHGLSTGEPCGVSSHIFMASLWPEGGGRVGAGGCEGEP